MEESYSYQRGEKKKHTIYSNDVDKYFACFRLDVKLFHARMLQAYTLATNAGPAT